MNNNELQLILNKLRWHDHKNHLELLKEFYYYNKFYLSEQMIDCIADAIECLEAVQSIKEHDISTQEGEL